MNSQEQLDEAFAELREGTFIRDTAQETSEGFGPLSAS
jgi:hypothetical protein